MTSILVGLDGSSRQAAVLSSAIRLARALDAGLILLRAVTVPAELPARAYAVPPDQLGELLLDEARKGLAAVAAQLPPDLRHEIHAVLGTPWRTLVDEAERRGAELIVIGSHGYGGLDRLLGTTAAKVVDHAKRSVLVVRGAA